MPFLRQNTIKAVRFGPFLDATDGVTEEEALTITQALRRISKDGGAFAQSSETGNSVHDSDGWYSDDLTAADTDTVGELVLNVQDPATHLPVWMRWWVLEEAVFDALYGAAANAFNASGHIQRVVLVDLTTANTDVRGTDGASLATVCTEARLSEMDEATAGKMANQVDEIRVDTGVIGAAGAGLSDLGGMSTGMKAEIQTEVDASLVTVHLDHLFAIAYDPAAIPGVADALLNELVEDDGGVSRFTMNALEQGPGGGGATPLRLQNTTIASLTSQTQFILTAGSADDDLYNNCMIIITDATTSVQKAIGFVDNYIGATKEIFLLTDPGIFPMAATDIVDIIALTPEQRISLAIGAISAATFSADAITNSVLAATAINKIRQGIVDDDTRYPGSSITEARLAKLVNLPEGIKKNAIQNNFTFIMRDATTGDPKTGLTVTATRRIDAGAFDAAANSVTEVSSGYYTIDLAASDLNGDVVTLRFTAAGAKDTGVTIKTNP